MYATTCNGKIFPSHFFNHPKCMSEIFIEFFMSLMLRCHLSLLEVGEWVKVERSRIKKVLARIDAIPINMLLETLRFL